MKKTEKEIQGGEDINPEYAARGRVVDSIYRYLKGEVKVSDTFALSSRPFEMVGLGGDGPLEGGGRNGQDILAPTESYQ